MESCRQCGFVCDNGITVKRDGEDRFYCGQACARRHLFGPKEGFNPPQQTQGVAK